MKFLIGVALFVPLAIVLGVFAVDNRVPVALQLWPLPGVYELGASVWVLGMLAVGTLFGLAVGWLSGAGARRRARRAENRLKKLEREAEEITAERKTAATAPTGAAVAGLLPADSRRRVAQIDD